METGMDYKYEPSFMRRKYRHVVEIMTYDDMLRRVKTIRDQFKVSPIQ
jgi:hypothetical protein